MSQERLQRLRALMAEQGLNSLFIRSPYNRRYLSGFTGTAGDLLITQEQAWLLTDFRYTEQAAEQAPHFQVLDHQGRLLELVAQLLKDAGVAEVGFEQQHLTYQQYKEMEDSLQPIRLLPVHHLVEQLRMIKDEQELQLIRQAARIADQAFAHILTLVKPGVSERELANELEYQMKKLGATGPSFDTIVASGPRSSLPHGVASERKLQHGDLITFDFGAVYQGYCSDLTRTVALGKVDPELEKIYEIVLRAQERALDQIRPGLAGKEADRLARQVIEEAGYGPRFGHSTGHAIGLEIHEEPSLSPRSDVLLREGMVVTVEPGIYLPGRGGVRIEDDVHLVAGGLEVLTSSPKEWVTL